MSFPSLSSNRFLFGHYKSLKKESKVILQHICCRKWWATFKVGSWRPLPSLRTPATITTFSLESTHLPWGTEKEQAQHHHNFTGITGCLLTPPWLFLPSLPLYLRMGIADPDPSHARRGRKQDLGQWHARYELSLLRRNLNPAPSITFLNEDPIPQGLHDAPTPARYNPVYLANYWTAGPSYSQLTVSPSTAFRTQPQAIHGQISNTLCPLCYSSFAPSSPTALLIASLLLIF